ncbi:MAG: HD domain-containing protein [Deltaproteobacteria bacterium]|nr:HD domain-containing protein [Deltaproteobacteria bacterium]
MIHEIRDPIHGFIKLDSDERRVLDSRPLQRLRHIHQLALTYFIYPGATHTRFEHSLGVMEVASRIYDVVTARNNLQACRRAADIFGSDFDLEYWRRVLRMAALCHDIGHLPFSHAAEKELLPQGWDHEKITIDFIQSDEMQAIWKDIRIDAERVAKIAVGPKKYKKDVNNTFTDIELILSQIITGNALGADRIDYLLRDSWHAGVAYGKFDHIRLIDCMRILPRKNDPNDETPAFGITHGGLYCAEALYLARYFMFMQIYYHPIRRIYDIHLREFIKELYPKGFPTNLAEFLLINDHEIWNQIFKQSFNDLNNKINIFANILAQRKHFKLLYEPLPDDIDNESIESNENLTNKIYNNICEKIGNDNVRIDTVPFKSGEDNDFNFPVYYSKNKKSISSHSLLFRLFAKKKFTAPEQLKINRVFVDRDKIDNARKLIETNNNHI